MEPLQQPDLIPPENRPGRHPAEEQDKPDLDAFAAKLGTDADAASRREQEEQREWEQQEEQEREWLVTTTVLLPLREIVKRLDQLEKKLTERLEGTRRRLTGSARR